jgi:hypothetical protein
MSSTTQETHMTSPKHGITPGTWWGFFSTVPSTVADVATFGPGFVAGAVAGAAVNFATKAIDRIIPDVDTYDDDDDMGVSVLLSTDQEVEHSEPPESIEMKEPSGPIVDDWVLA